MTTSKKTLLLLGALTAAAAYLWAARADRNLSPVRTLSGHDFPAILDRIESERRKADPTAALIDSAYQIADTAVGASPRRPLSLSMIQLIARPDDFHGKYVQLFGYYRTEHEGTSIYLHREDFEQGLYKNGLWVARDSTALDRKYVLIEGRFDAKRQGHMGLWSGEIDVVTRMMAWPPPPVRTARQ